MTARPDWPHQIYAVDEVVKRLSTGVSSVCLTSPTGGGKSVCIQRLCERWVAMGKGVSILSSRRLLTAQLERVLKAEGIDVAVRAADYLGNYSAPVQVCSVQTELARTFTPRDKAVANGMDPAEAERTWPLPDSQLLIVEEAHMNKGDSVQRIVDEYRQKHGAQVVGITATPLGISHMYSELVVAGNNSQLRACGALVPAMCYEPFQFDLPKIRRSKTGIFTQAELNEATKAIWSQHIVGNIFTHWKKLNSNATPGLGMAPGRKESLGLAMEFHKHGVNAAHICSEGIFVDGKWYTTTAQADRDEVFEKSRDGRSPMIWNRFTMREGIDLPWLEHLVLATPIASLLSFVQVCGRVLRACPSTSKRTARIVDHGGNFWLHGSPNADRDRDWMYYFHDKPSQVTKDRIERFTNQDSKEPQPIVCPQCTGLRATGSKCPHCGFQHEKSVRIVVQESGKLRKITGDFYKKRRVENHDNTAKLWSGVYWRCRNAKKPMTFNQAMGLFRKMHKYDPPLDLPFMPKERIDWNRLVRVVPMGRLHRKPQTHEAGLFD